MSIKKRKFGFFQDEAGVSAVEFSLILVPLLLLIFGIVEFGRALQIRNEVERSLDIAAREFEINRFRDSFSVGSSCENDRSSLEARFLAQISTSSRAALVPNSDNLSISITCVTSVDHHIMVEANYRFPILIPFYEINILNLSVGRLVEGPWVSS